MNQTKQNKVIVGIIIIIIIIIVIIIRLGLKHQLTN